MAWECPCGVLNKDSGVNCRSCGFPKGMDWRPVGFKTLEEEEAAWELIDLGFEIIELSNPQGMRGIKIRRRVKNWAITLEAITEKEHASLLEFLGLMAAPHVTLVAAMGGPYTHTRIRAPYLSKDNFAFETVLFPSALSLRIAKFFADVPYFVVDRLMIKANDELKLRALLANPNVHRLFQTVPWDLLRDVRFELWSYHAALPTGVAMLYFESAGLVAGVGVLKALFDLFEESLHGLCHIGSASEEEANVSF